MTSRTGSRNSTRPGSSLGQGNAAPFTPRQSKNSAAKYGGLSAKQANKISHTIASVRRHRRGSSGVAEEGQSPLHAGGSLGPSAAYADAPLNSRLPALSPRRIASSSRKPYLEEEELSDEDSGMQTVGRATEPSQLFPTSLRDVPVDIQEALLVEDLLFVLVGIDGSYVRFDPEHDLDDSYESMQKMQFIIHPELDRSLEGLVSRIVPLASYYASINSFIEKFSHASHGLVFHALCAVLRTRLREYLTLLAQLENHFNNSPDFTLIRLWGYVGPTLETFELIHHLILQLAPSPQEVDGSTGGEGDDGESDISTEDEAVRAVRADMKKNDPKFALHAAKNIPIIGGEILAILSELCDCYAGNRDAHKLYSDLLLRASQPYARILIKWIRTGSLDDPYEEFMVRQSKVIERGNLETDYIDEVWEKMYTLRDQESSGGSISDNSRRTAESGRSASGRADARARGLAGGAIVPSFLEGWKVKIFLAGKYLNVSRECGTDASIPDEEEAVHNDENDAAKKIVERKEEEEEQVFLVDMRDSKFHHLIEHAYTYSNKMLLNLLIKSQSLVPRLTSLKHQFFMDQGDSFTHFLDLASYELSKKAKNISLSKLQSLLDLAIRNPSSASGSDPYKEDVKVKLSNTTLVNWLLKVVSVSGVMGGEDVNGGNTENALLEKDEPSSKKEEDDALLTGFDVFELDYAVKFPLSLILSKKAILRYQLIFRHLLSLKHLEQSLTTTWLEHTKSPVWRKSTGYPKLENWKLRVFSLRARMLTYVQHMYAFSVNEVLEPNWHRMVNKIESCNTVDELLRDHVDFLDTCLKECMLTNAKLLKLHSKLMTACTLFTSYTSQFSKLTSQAIASLQLADGDPSMVKLDKQISFLQRFEHNFNHYSNLHTQTVTYFASTETIALLALVVRLGSVKIPGTSSRDQSVSDR